MRSSGRLVGSQALDSASEAEKQRGFADEFGTATWYVTRHEPEKWFIEMLKILPGITACRLEIQLIADGEQCLADITYSHTSLGEAGDEFVARFTADHIKNSCRPGKWSSTIF